MRGEAVEQHFEQGFFARKCAFLRGQGFIFKRFEFGRDVALGVFQGLATAVIGGDVFRLGAADFDVKAVHLVVFDLERVDAAARAFAGFELQQKRPGVTGQRT